MTCRRFGLTRMCALGYVVSMEKKELDEVLRLHGLWCGRVVAGARADLQWADLEGADLRDAYLRDADLRDAYLRDADLRGADLRGASLRDANLWRASLWDANLQGADLQGADLQGAYLHGANLHGANLRGANLRGANLRGANLRGANLRDANLQGADPQGADLQGADPQGADLHGAYLHGAYLHGANLPDFQLCPASGVFTGYKKVSAGFVLKLEIDASEGCTSSLVGRKCRARKVRVVGWMDALDALVGVEGEVWQTSPKSFMSSYDGCFTYDMGEVSEVVDWCDDVRLECVPGIHFFMTLEEARAW